jgi:methenyltetrahydrofolate cyclohydrolase
MKNQPPTTNHRPLFSEMALADLIDAFSSTAAVPGGGSAAALAGAVGTSLLIMVAGLPKTRTDAPEETADLAAASSRLHPLRDALLELVDRDSEAYRQVMEAFRLPKESEAEKAARKQVIDRAMRAATEAPLDTMRACQQALRGAVIVAANGSRKATSDVGVAIELLLAGLRGARMNVEINLSTLDDALYLARVKTEVLELERDAAVDADTARGALR